MFEGLRNWVYEQFNKDGQTDHEYLSVIDDPFSGVVNNNSDMLEYSQRHPILSGGLLFICNLFAQAKFEIKNKDGTVHNGSSNHILTLLQKPNYFQTGIDFLEALQWIKIVRGSVVVAFESAVGFEDEPDAMFVLDPKRIEYPDGFKTPTSREVNDPMVANQIVRYRQDSNPDNDKLYKIKNLMYLYDSPNIKNPKNKFLTGSRCDGLKQTLDNTVDSLIAKQIILRSNGKELLSSKSNGSFPMTPEDKMDAEKMFNLGYGTAKNRARALITKADVSWQSMHVALRDLGLDESTKVDGNIVFTALHIPKDILSLEAKKTTYNNFRESMTSFIQNGITSMALDFAISLQVYLGLTDVTIVPTYEHLPVMQHLMKEKYSVKKLQAETLGLLRAAGMPDEEALEEAGFDKNIKLNEYVHQGNQENDDDDESGPTTSTDQ